MVLNIINIPIIFTQSIISFFAYKINRYNNFVTSFGYVHNLNGFDLCIFSIVLKKEEGNRVEFCFNSDLAVEMKGSYSENEGEYSEEEIENCTVCRLNISDENLSKKYGREAGKYTTVFCDNIFSMDRYTLATTASIIAKEIENMLVGVVPNKKVCECKVLIVGLGNIEITTDALGPLTVKNINVTRHIKILKDELSSNTYVGEISAIAPGVLSQTGIETVEIVKAIASCILPDVIIAVDSLAARNSERVGATVQISDNGISPGTGIGNYRKSINRHTVGCPVVAVGIPSVVASSLMVFDTLIAAGFEKIDDTLVEKLKEKKNMYVTPKECDEILRKSVELLSMALNITFGLDS